LARTETVGMPYVLFTYLNARVSTDRDAARRPVRVTFSLVSTEPSDVSNMLNAAPSADSQTGESRELDRLNDRSPSKSQESLQRALRTLSGIRERYEVGRHAHPDARFYSVHVVVDRGDVAWINATIGALEKAIAASATNAAAPAALARPNA